MPAAASPDRLARQLVLDEIFDLALYRVLRRLARDFSAESPTAAGLVAGLAHVAGALGPVSAGERYHGPMTATRTGPKASVSDTAGRER